MEKTFITEEQIKNVLVNLLNEEMSKVSRQDFARVQFKIEELQNSLNDTIKEFKKLETSIPTGLKNTTNKKVISISSYLYGVQKEINSFKEIVKNYKRKLFLQQVEEKK